MANPVPSSKGWTKNISSMASGVYFPLDHIPDPSLQFYRSQKNSKNSSSASVIIKDQRTRNGSESESECCIYRVPERLRRLNPEAYSPRFIAIGPLHHGKEELQAMEEHKLRYLQSFIPRTDLSIEELVETVRTWEERARNCYAEPLKLSSHDFVKMMIIDGSFLVELILKFRYPELVGESDRIYKKPRMVYDVVRDMILLENQLPGFVVKAIFGLLSVHYRERIHPEIIHHFFGFVLSMNGFSQGKFISEPDHFIDLIRSRCLPSVPHRSEAQTKKLDTPPAAIELNNAGVRFKLEKTRSYSLDISFANGVITIPTIIIGDLTETLYRNIIAFEQCHYESASDNYFTQYALLLSCFMKSAMDADFLARCGILVNRLGNGEDVSRLFNSIYKEVFVSRFYFQTLSEDLNSYCNKPWNKWKATLRRDYFKNPWSVASVLAAAVLLLLTFTQTVCSILAL